MCGIAGVVDLTNQRAIPPEVVRAMAQAIFHRGPDEDGFLERSGMALASRRLSIVGLADGKQPISNEDGRVSVVFNGELFDYPERKAELEGRGHRFRTHCDTELIPHFWEDHAEGMFEHLHGQFALALWDSTARRLILARDRVGICPLFWTRQGDWLLFASEIKALLASGMVEARPDPRGINTVFTFFALPGPTTCFQGINCLLPGHFLDIRFGKDGEAATITDRKYWEIDFPDEGQEDPGHNHKKVIDGFEQVMLQSVERRLRADVPVVSYLSGGVDSSLVVALACHIRKEPIPTFTIQVKSPRFDETSEALKVARHVGASPVIVGCGSDEVRNTYPALIRAAESPVIDTSCAALLMLAREVHAQGYKVALTGEGADEWLAGYPWYQIHKLLKYTDVIPGLERLLRRVFPRVIGAPRFPEEYEARLQAAVGGPNPWLDVYGLMSLSKLHFFAPEMRERALQHVPYEDLGLNLERARRWHPLNRALYIGARVMLPGLLLSSKGDRVAMNSSVETRYPFLDEDVFRFLAQLHPRWKLRGFREKYVLRPLAERWLPKEIAWRRKAMFRAPFDSFHEDRLPPYVDELLSPESLKKAGYFDTEAVRRWRADFRKLRSRSYLRTSVEMGLVGVFATQLWHHTYIERLAADLPTTAADFRSPQPLPEKRLAIPAAEAI
ncbi:asparagine synthetase B [Planctomycetaceae bacterium SCGC AG-212-D15]|nr:asparagine synthetase B [Planctomycetaceae bacterium SCGC AG-212-D15]